MYKPELLCPGVFDDVQLTPRCSVSMKWGCAQKCAPPTYDNWPSWCNKIYRDHIESKNMDD